MNEILQSLPVVNEKRWYLFSLFYAKEKWADLITEIERFHKEKQNRFCNYLFSFSREKGEHLNVVFATPFIDNNDYSNEIQTCFQSYLYKNPSMNSAPFPYGKAVWANYPNNSFVWNTFSLPNYSNQYINFHQRTMEVALKLLSDDFSEDAFFSLGIYLLTKPLCCISSKEQKSILFQALNDVSIGSPHFVYTAKELVNEININEAGEAIESYLNENVSDCSPEIINWLNEVKILLKYYSYNELFTFIFKITGLTGLRQLMILELMNRWYNKEKDENRK